MNKNSGTSRRVLAVRGGALGDFILTLPAIKALRDGGWQVSLLSSEAHGAFAQAVGLVDQWRPLDGLASAGLMAMDAPVNPQWRAWLSGFTAVVSWFPDYDGAFQHQIRGCGVGQFYQGDWRCAGRGPAGEQLGQVVHPLVPHDLNLSGVLGPSPLLGIGCSSMIAIHPGSGSASKNWPLNRWIEVMKHIQLHRPELSWLVITGEVEADRAGDIETAMNASGFRWRPAASLDLNSLTCLLRECGGLLGHDSGISHLAAACGVPCRLLFGPTNPDVWAPQGDHVEVLRAPSGDLSGLSVAAVVQWLGERPFSSGPAQRKITCGPLPSSGASDPA